jgi:hypothetical protein
MGFAPALVLNSGLLVFNPVGEVSHAVCSGPASHGTRHVRACPRVGTSPKNKKKEFGIGFLFFLFFGGAGPAGHGTCHASSHVRVVERLGVAVVAECGTSPSVKG